MPHFITYRNFMPWNLSQFSFIFINWLQKHFLLLILKGKKVNLVLQIFNEYTVQWLGKQKYLPNFVEYTNIFYIWWTIMNIKTLDKGCWWCNAYRRRKWTRQHEFKSWTRLIAFHKALIPLGKVWIQSFSLQLRVNSRADKVL